MEGNTSDHRSDTLPAKKNLKEVVVCNLKREDRERIEENPRAKKLYRKKEKSCSLCPGNSSRKGLC